MSVIPQARIHGVDDLRLDSVDSPRCGDDDVVVQVHECGICGTDLGFLAMGGISDPDVPMRIGHELWGRVSEIGANVTHVAVGDRVVVQPMANDANIGNGGREGGFTSHLLVRDAAKDPAGVLVLPEDLPETFGALVEPLAVAQHGVNRVSAQAGDKCVVYGAGPIGLSMVQMLLSRGIDDIVVVDLSDMRLATAQRMGAIALRGDDPELADKLIEIHGQESFFGLPVPASDLYFEATGVRAVFEGLLNIAGPRSRICLTGVHKEPAQVDLVLMLAKELSIVAAMGYEGEFDEVIELLRSGRIDPSVMVTHHFPLSRIEEAFSTARDTENAIKVMIDCQA